MLILGRLDSAEDIAMAECASKELRDLVAEHDADFWKTKCENLLECYRQRQESDVPKPRCGDLFGCQLPHHPGTELLVPLLALCLCG
jgi:hypothetical protein